MHYLPWSAKARSSRGTIYRLLLSKSSLDLQDLLGTNWQLSYVPTKFSTGVNVIKLLSILNGNKIYLLLLLPGNLHWARQEEDCHRYGCHLCSEEARPNPLRIRWLNNPNLQLNQANPILIIFTNVCKAILVYPSDWYQALLIKTDWAEIAWQE